MKTALNAVEKESTCLPAYYNESLDPSLWDWGLYYWEDHGWFISVNEYGVLSWNDKLNITPHAFSSGVIGGVLYTRLPGYTGRISSITPEVE